jgi:hypothetical protein
VTQLFFVFLIISGLPFPFIPTVHKCIFPGFLCHNTSLQSQGSTLTLWSSLHFIPLTVTSNICSCTVFFLPLLWSHSSSICSFMHTLLEHTQASRLLQLLCTYPATKSYIDDVFYVLWVIEMLVCCVHLCTPWWWASKAQNMRLTY